MWVWADTRTDRTSVLNYIDAWSCFWLVKEGRYNEKSSQDELKKLAPSAYGALVDHVYQNLTILDAKSNVLIASASIFTAALGIILSTGHSLNENWLVVSLSVTTFISLISVIFTLSVVYVHWSSAADLNDLHIVNHVYRLVDIRNSRTLRFRIAWTLHIVVIVFSFAMIFGKLLSFYLGLSGSGQS